MPGAGDSEVNEADKAPAAAMGQTSASRRQMLTKHCRSSFRRITKVLQLESDCQRGFRKSHCSRDLKNEKEPDTIRARRRVFRLKDRPWSC